MTKKTTTTPRQRAMLDQLAENLRDVPTERLESLLVKRGRISLRVTDADKASIEQTAQACNLTVTEYITRIHYLAIAGLRGGRRG